MAVIYLILSILVGIGLGVGWALSDWSVALEVLRLHWPGILVATVVIVCILSLLIPPAPGRGEEGW